MFCPACGSRNSDDARFCNQCGVRMASMAPVDAPPVASPPQSSPPAEAVPTQRAAPLPPGPADAAGSRPPVNWPQSKSGSGTTKTGDSIALPMAGPSRRTLVVAAVCIALAGVAIGAVAAWRAFRRPSSSAAVSVPAPVPVTNVALVEQPLLLSAGDAGAGAAGDNTTPRGGTAVRATGTRGARTVAAAGGASNPAGARTAGATPATGGNTARPGAAGGAGNNAGARGPAGNGNPAGAPAGPAGFTPPAGGGADNTAGGADNTAGNSENPGGENPGGENPGGAGPSPEVPAGAPGGPRGPSVGGYSEGTDTDATGRMDPQVFSYVYRHYRSQVANCHATASRGHEVVGTMRVRVRLALDGHVSRTRVMSDTTHDQGLEECVQGAIRTWRYPQPEGGEVEFEYSFGFGSN